MSAARAEFAVTHLLCQTITIILANKTQVRRSEDKRWHHWSEGGDSLRSADTLPQLLHELSAEAYHGNTVEVP